MNREVAIKRISSSVDDFELQEESTRQLMKEAGALASLQHPHIVTVYDVGADEDGPYVVMELITGKTLDELIENAPLTWADFRELAMQTQEALIAAQELNLIHSDLKPSNLMLTWLPSGKFQVKIVDFGLATLTQSQPAEDIESLDAVFGSVFFMPPEQFERTPLDARSDIYSIGCVYYQALTGLYPFDGKTGNEVMESHLHHKVKPLHEVRAGIPIWACEWIMWHLNRYPQDRPESSREALSVFLKNDRSANAPMSLGISKPVVGPPRPRLSAARPAPTAVAPAAPGPPAPQALVKASLVQTAQVTTISNEGSAITQTAPQALAPPVGFKPSVHTSLLEPEVIPPTQPQTQPAAVPRQQPDKGSGTQRKQEQDHPQTQPRQPQTTLLHNLGKTAKLVLTISSAVLLVILGILVFKLVQFKQSKQTFTDLLAKAETAGASSVPVNGPSLRILLNAMLKPELEAKMPSIGKALKLAAATDGTDVDARIAEFATQTPQLSRDAKDLLIGTVLLERNNPVILPLMMNFATSPNESILVVSALQAVRQLAGDEQFPAFLKLIQTTKENEVRVSAELNSEAVIKRSQNVEILANQLKSAQAITTDPNIRKTLQRLLAKCNAVKPPVR